MSLRRIVFAEYKDSTRYKQGAHIGARVGHCIHARAGSGCGPLMVVGGSCPIYLISKRHDNGLPKICSDSAPTTLFSGFKVYVVEPFFKTFFQLTTLYLFWSFESWSHGS